MMRNLVKNGCGRKAVESFTDMKARIKTSNIQPLYLQCEDLHCKANLKLHRKRKIPGISRIKNGGEKILRAVVKGKFLCYNKNISPMLLRVQCYEDSPNWR